MAEKVLEHINETIREQEGRERLKEISKDLWVGQGCVSAFLCSYPHRSRLCQTSRFDCAHEIHGFQEVAEGRDPPESEEWTEAARVPVQRHPRAHRGNHKVAVSHGMSLSQGCVFGSS